MADGGDNNPGDAACNDGTGNCTLRAAIEEANANGGTDTIAFNISGTGPHTIQPNSSLPTITDPVIIDGTTEPDFVGTPIIELDGSNAGDVNGLKITAGNSTVRGLVINRFGLTFSANGIQLVENGGNVIEGNYIGTDVTGALALGNVAGVLIHSANNVVGGTTAEARNIISGNLETGVTFSGFGATGNRVEGNYIGTDVTGTLALGNRNGVGVFASGNTIGGATAGTRNIISGNHSDGVSIDSAQLPAFGNRVQGNYIGTDVTGTLALGNNVRGVNILNASDNLIGGSAANEGNLISGNGAQGVWISGFRATGNLVQGNHIGTDLTGTIALPSTVPGRRGNNSHGIRIDDGAQFNVIGTNGDGVDDDAERNLISGNTLDGIRIEDPNTDNNIVAGNYIGTDVNGTATIFNGQWGVGIWNFARLNRVGTDGDGVADAAERNLISGNFLDGVVITFEAEQNVVAGNYIGTDVTGTRAVPNSGVPGSVGGISIANGAKLNRIGTNADGLSDELERNVISGNVFSGIVIFNDVRTGTDQNVIAGNLIGTQADGTSPLGNGSDGVVIGQLDPSNNTIGGTAKGAGNTIAFNGGDGVFIRSGTGNAILSNSIFSNARLGIDLNQDGVTNNDAGDGDRGPNNLHNFPVLTSATAGTSIIEGTLNSTPSTTFTLEVFSSSACDPSGFGEGETFLGSTMVTTDGSGNASFTVAFPAKVLVGWFVTATATDPNDNTSEFSQCIEAEAKLYFAQFGNGQGLTSDAVLTNPSASSTASGKVDFLDDNGLPLPVGIVAEGGG
ncbi:hypothetical protein MYX82_14320, partial [Acidobacteria bacterium AH-259-D05]|nr:hypothetical protein [Acidobacteria bacterium AH-259-D05]